MAETSGSRSTHHRRRHVPTPVRRPRTVAGLALLGVLAVVASNCSGNNPATPGEAQGVATSGAVPAAESGLLPWKLASPISRSVVLPGSGSQLVLLGGLAGATTSASGVFSLDTSNGALRQVGQLRTGVHDAVGGVAAGQDLVIGGGSPSTVATVEGFPASAASGAGASPSTTASAVGSLPAPRSDAGAATIGATTYVVGGYDGTRPEPTVLGTTNGRTFQDVASLEVPVRYPAVAALGNRLYVFGGQAISGAQSGQPVDDIQVVDPGAHKAWVAGKLPEPLAGAAAMTVGGHVYLAGGDSSAPQPSTPGMGSTQLAPSTPGANRGAGASGAITDAHVTGAGARRTAGVHTTASGGPGGATASTIWAFDPSNNQVLTAGHLQVPVSHAGVAVIGSTAWVVGGETNGSQVSAVQMITPNRAFGTAGAPGAGSPYFGGKLLVADRGNNRLLLMNSSMQVVWSYPSPSSPPDPLGFYFPDDAFFVNKGSAIISNQEQNETIVQIGYPSGKIVWSYGHPKQPGTAPGYLHEPDDAYLLKNGQITVADAQNCRVLVLNSNGTVAHQIGTNGRCVHDPPTSMGSPNGDTPLADGNLLVSEINGSWVTEYTPTGNMVWTVHLPISYPSDPQQLGPNLYLIADYAHPGSVLEFNRQGQILYRYAPPSGPGMLDHPSLAERLPSGVIMVNDDYRDRMVAFDPTTGALVWQYGVNDQAGTSPGMLNTPDGFDLLMPGGATPTHSAAG